MFNRRKSEQGSALALAILVIVVVAGMGAALATVSSAQNRTSSTFHMVVEATYVAEGALEQAKYLIATSTYDINGNTWLNLYANVDDGDGIYPSPGDTPVPATILDPTVLSGSRVPIGRGTAEMFVYSEDTVGQMYRVVVRATVGDRTVVFAQDIRARDTFARFATFVNTGDLAFAASTVSGDVHSNGNIWFYGPGGNFTDRVSAVGGFNMMAGASMANTSFGSFKTGASRIDLPPVRSIDTLRAATTAEYDVHQSNPMYACPNPVSAEIELLGNLVKITARDSVTGTVLNPLALPVPLPPDGVIYVQGDVTSIKGSSMGQVTVATPGSIDVTGRLTYKDSLGNPAYLLLNGGVPVPGNDTPSGVVWDSSYSYVPNPAYTPGSSPPVIGLMAGVDVEITPAADYNMEVHAAVLAATSNWYANSDPGNVKGNIRFVGSLSSNTAGYRSAGTDGWSLSGGYVYDRNLMSSPPPKWLNVEQPFWGPRRKVSSS
jgi:hypothetical protein